ncbi:MAG: ABC transporter ATP-binding protein [Armatimonadetes bacterium]|nr:ABC transporter ATP-binding protein [Candidatus Hippobium faecium]
MALAIDVKNFCKHYLDEKDPKQTAVENVNFQVKEGEIFGFIGPNGAGKTTTIKTLLGLLKPTSGEITILGKPLGDIEIKKRISYLPENPYFYQHMNSYEILDFYGQLFKIPKDIRQKRIAELLEKVGLAKDGKRNLKEYSKGMLQRVGLAQTLINEPDLVFLDEPTSGLDPIAHKDIQDIIFDLKKNGKTVFMSSHQLSDVENVCDRVAIIKRGKIVRMGTMEELLEDGITVITVDNASDELIKNLSDIADKIKPDGKRYNIYVKNQENIYKVIDTVRSKANLISVVPQKQSLEDLFVDIIRGGKE